MLQRYDILSESTIERNYDILIRTINSIFPTRSELLLRMYRDYTYEHVLMAPASSYVHFHNAFVGGYVDHILRVFKFAMEVHRMWKNFGIAIDYTLEELAFVAIHHDLGKLGLPNGGDPIPRYLVNDDDWSKNTKGKMYKTNDQLQFMLVPDMSLFVLQQYNISLSINEVLGIKLHDGLYDYVNKPYYVSYNEDAQLKTKLPHVIHQADLMASKYEYDYLKSISA